MSGQEAIEGLDYEPDLSQEQSARFTRKFDDLFDANGDLVTWLPYRPSLPVGET